MPPSRDQRFEALGLFAERIDGSERELLDLRLRREEAKAAGNTALVAELSVEILDRVEKAGQALAADLKLQTNEQTKYSGTFVNGMAIAIFSAGVITPVLGVFVPAAHMQPTSCCSARCQAVALPQLLSFI